MLDLWISGSITVILLRDTIDGDRAITACNTEDMLSNWVEFYIEDGIR